MKKKIIILAASLFLIATGVSASSLNGEYNGNPIVKMKSNGALLSMDEVPSMIIDGHTMVPISTLRQIGANVTWNPNEYSVDVTLPKPQPINPTTSIKTISDTMVQHNGYNFRLTYDKTSSYTNVDMTSTYDSKKDTDNVGALLYYSAGLEADIHYVKFTNDLSFSVAHLDMLEYMNSKINADELWKRIKTINATPSTIPQPNVSTKSSVQTNNVQACNNIISKYYVDTQAVIELFASRGGLYSGGLQAQKDNLKSVANSQLTTLGCTQIP